LIDQAGSWGIPKGVIVCDCAYGNGNPFRQGLIDRELFYVAKIEAKTIVFNEPRKTRRREGDPPSEYFRLIDRRTSKSAPPRQWLLIEWPKGEPEPAKYWISNLLPQTGISRLVFFAKVRWRIEQSYQQLKEELGLDHYEGRGYSGWHHHVTMTMLAYGFLLLETLRNKKNFRVDPPESEAGDAAPDSVLVGDMPDLQ